jgi:hypothetical protein
MACSPDPGVQSTISSGFQVRKADVKRDPFNFARGFIHFIMVSVSFGYPRIEAPIEECYRIHGERLPNIDLTATMNAPFIPYKVKQHSYNKTNAKLVYGFRMSIENCRQQFHSLDG